MLWGKQILMLRFLHLRNGNNETHFIGLPWKLIKAVNVDQGLAQRPVRYDQPLVTVSMFLISHAKQWIYRSSPIPLGILYLTWFLHSGLVAGVESRSAPLVY